MESAGCLVTVSSASCGAPLLQTPAATANEAPTQPLIGLVWAELRLGWLRALISVTSSYVIRMEGRRDLHPLGRTATNTFSGWQMLEPKMGRGWGLTAKGCGLNTPPTYISISGDPTAVYSETGLGAAVCLRLLA